MTTRRCPGCARRWRGRRARFCGACGEPLVTTTRSRTGRRAGGVALAAVGVAAGVVAATGVWGEVVSRAGGPAEVGGAVSMGAPAPGPGPGPARVRAVGGGLSLVVHDGRLVASEAASGADRFVVALPDLGIALDGPDGEAATVSVRGHAAGVVVASAGVAVGLDPDGDRLWSHGTARTRTDVVAADDERTVLAGPLDDAAVLLVEVVDSIDGTVRFGREVAAVVAVEEQTVLVRDLVAPGGVTAVSLLDGSVRWRTEAVPDER